MYHNFNNYMPRKVSYKQDDRFIPFAGPFLLGALTGGVAVSAVGPRPRPYNNYYPGYYGRPPFFY